MFSTRPDGIDLMYWEAELNAAMVAVRTMARSLTHPDFISRERTDWMANAEKDVEETILTPGLLSDGIDIPAFRSEAIRRMDKAFWERLECFGATLVNLGLVEQCSIFEKSLTDTLGRILRQREEIFVGLLSSESVPIRSLLNRDPKESTWERLISWKLEIFAKESVQKKLEYFSKNFKIRKTELCDSRRFNESFRTAYEGKGYDFLMEIFDKRHKIVHDLQRPLRDCDELSYYHNFLRQVVARLVIRAMSEFKLEPNALGVNLRSAK